MSTLSSVRAVPTRAAHEPVTLAVVGRAEEHVATRTTQGDLLVPDPGCLVEVCGAAQLEPVATGLTA